MTLRPPFDDFPEFETNRILLTEVSPAFVEELMTISFYDGKAAQTIEEAIQMNDRISNNYRCGETIHWAIIDKQSGKAIGTCGYYRGFENEAGEIGCVLLPEARGKGYMCEALQLITQFGCVTLKLVKIWAITDYDNLAAQKLLDRLNFKQVHTQSTHDLYYEFT